MTANKIAYIISRIVCILELIERESAAIRKTNLLITEKVGRWRSSGEMKIIFHENMLY